MARRPRSTEYTRAMPRPRRALQSEKIVDYDDIEIEEIPDENPDYSYLEQEGWEDQLDAFRRGDFYFVGIRATVPVVINGYTQRFHSPGLWGIESNSSHEYLEEVANEERAQLLDTLHELGIKIRNVPTSVSRSWARQARLRRGAPGR